MAFGNMFMGVPERFERIPKFGATQISGLEDLLKLGLSQYRNPYEGFEPIKQQALSTLQNQILPQVAQRFTTSTGGALSSPSFASQVGSATQGLAERLAAMQAQFGQQNRSNALQALQFGFTPRDEIGYFQAQPGFLQSLLGGIAPAAGKALTYGAAYALGVPPALLNLLAGGRGSFMGSQDQGQ